MDNGTTTTSLGHLLLLVPLLLLLGLGDNCLVTAGTGGGMGGGGGGISSAQQLREGTHKLCGPVLTNAMDLVCVGGYNSMSFASKRVPRRATTASSVELGTQQRRRQPRYTHSGPLQTSLKTRRLRRQRFGGVYDECCVNSCNYEELLAYCRQQ